MSNVDLAEQLRKAVADAGLNPYQLAKRAGLPYAVAHGFLAGTRDMQLSSASKVCRLLGLELRSVQRGTRKPKGR